jgi:Leucine-rich repeat (LRR) protein
MRYLIPLLLLLGCTSQKTSTVFDASIGQQEVVINLDDYSLDSIPPDIKVLKNAWRLYIFKGQEKSTKNPVQGAAGEKLSSSFGNQIPDELCELITLRSLSLANLKLKTLPTNFVRLQNLDSLMLFWNDLNISNELAKLKELKRLKYLGILGNQVTKNDLDSLYKWFPGIVINPGMR